MNWLANNWIWLVAFGFLAMMMFRRRHGTGMGCGSHRSHDARPVEEARRSGSSVTPEDLSQGREGERHHRHRGCC